MKFLKCNMCGNIATLMVDKGASIVCCGADMIVLVPNTVDASTEKHVPMISRCKNKITVKVGSVIHPNDESHHINFIALHTNVGVQYKVPPIGSEPVAVFNVQNDEVVIAAYEYCNLHGLWKKDIE